MTCCRTTRPRESSGLPARPGPSAKPGQREAPVRTPPAARFTWPAGRFRCSTTPSAAIPPGAAREERAARVAARAPSRPRRSPPARAAWRQGWFGGRGRHLCGRGHCPARKRYLPFQPGRCRTGQRGGTGGSGGHGKAGVPGKPGGVGGAGGLGERQPAAGCISPVAASPWREAACRRTPRLAGSVGRAEPVGLGLSPVAA